MPLRSTTRVGPDALVWAEQNLPELPTGARLGGWGHPSLGGRGYLFPFRTCARNFPVYEFGSFAMTSGEPAPTT